ncbi:SCP2 sterol-binding domain-containing protein 1 [Balamuthia mandrillaris]
MKSEPIFTTIANNIKADPSLVSKIGGVYQFNVADGNGVRSWTVDLKNGSGSVQEGKAPKADCTISIKDEDFAAMAAGQLDGQTAFMQGKIKISGNMAFAMKLGQLFNAKAGAAAATSSAGSGDLISTVFAEIEKNLKADPSMVQRVGGTYRFDITTANGEVQTWGLNLKDAPGSVSKGEPAKPGCTMAMKEQDFIDMMTGKTDGQALFMQGKLKIQGNMALAMKLGQVLGDKLPKQAKL